ncbi:MAG: hypothetical protein C6W57_10025 [Caldibacillus debilis]|uniref:restriction endonuclease subunit S n=1 Tax=Caldibacillus debilis TaxID=301148 RepID=UPI000E36AD9B|nr:restriction endonuclease subunit S [Caldibacillus debilis]REJ15793.1 MAG: hypothetical protein C6W57_10025 [Caldibacillus debilis]
MDDSQRGEGIKISPVSNRTAADSAEGKGRFVNENKRCLKLAKEKSREKFPDGFFVPKEMEPYPLPEGWAWVFFDKVVIHYFERKKQLPKKKYRKEGRLPVVDQGQPFIAGYTDLEEFRFSGDLPVVIFGDHTRCIKWVDFDFVAGAEGTKILRPVSFIDPKYFYYLLKNIPLPDRGYSRHFKYLKKMPLAVAPMPEQKRIVEKIDLFMWKIERAKMLIAEVKESLSLRKAGLLQKAFIGYFGPNGPEDGGGEETSSATARQNGRPLPENWKWVPLGSVVHFYTGSPFPGGLEKGKGMGYPFYKVGDLKYADENGYLSEAEITVDEKTRKRMKANPVPEGTVIFAKIGEAIRLNRRAIVPRPACIDSNLMGMKADERYVDDKFLFYWSLKEDFFRYTRATSVPSIRKSTLTAIPFPLPPLEEQKRIVRTLDGLVKKLEAERRRLLEAEEALGLLERSILDRAFRGKLGTAGEKDEPIVLQVKKTFSPCRK